MWHNQGRFNLPPDNGGAGLFEHLKQNHGRCEGPAGIAYALVAWADSELLGRPSRGG